ncbi:hypothetical protein [Herpetosiphon giganteus]|uniref:hypothetical protein n=1 Tax=Herpetosiphon giganteus TaxID=2029754 RepID=UPI00195A84BF|nr:hypothetical protein [Herpetosiphon giganteus]MBM7843880.1 hypothetical protein [Herpetosiphon giganteus]
MKLLQECFGVLRSKVGLLLIAGVMLGIFFFERSVLGGLLAGATPIVMLLACLIPCAIPLLFLRRKQPANQCVCGDPNCGGLTSK